MARGNNVAIISLEEAKVRFEEWRKNRRGKARIPAELWAAAVEVARKEGINRTARELHVAWDDLKRHMSAAARPPIGCGSRSSSAATGIRGVGPTAGAISCRMHT
jgi:hypothetical protein